MLLTALLALLPAHAGTVQLTTSDRVTLSAEHSGNGSEGVVLLHGLNADRSGWTDTAGVLAENGVQVLALDLRGHGSSKGEPEATSMGPDVVAAITYLRKRGADRVVVVGEKLGANLALAAASADPEVAAVVMISPALNAHGVKVSSALAGVTDRPVLLVAGQDDALGRKAVDLIDKELDASTIEILETGGTGFTLVNRATDLSTTLLDWVRGKTDPDAAEAIQTGATDDLETTGTKLGDKPR